MNTLDLNATYTVTYLGNTEPTTITPTVRIRERDGKTLTIIKNLAPFFAEQIDAIEDESARMHTLLVLASGAIFINDTPNDELEDGWHSGSYYRDRGRLSTTYQGTSDLPVDAVLDLAEQLRAHFADESLGEPEDHPAQADADLERDARVDASLATTLADEGVSEPSADYVLVTTSTEDAEEAAALAEICVSNRLAACAHIQKVDTVRWLESEVATVHEWHITFKTPADVALILQTAILGMHSSDYPSLIVTPIIDGSPTYFAWLTEQTA